MDCNAGSGIRRWIPATPTDALSPLRPPSGFRRILLSGRLEMVDNRGIGVSDGARMKYEVWCVLAAASVLALRLQAQALPVIPGDSTRGAQVFESERCIRCHAVNGLCLQ